MVLEPYLQRYNPETPQPPFHLQGFLDPNKGKELEQIWGVDENKFVFYHSHLGPANIKVEVTRKAEVTRAAEVTWEAKVTGLLDWETAGFLPRGWIATKCRVSGGMDFDWDSDEDEEDQTEITEWRSRLAKALVEEKGYKEFPIRWAKWKKNQLGDVSWGYMWFMSLLPGGFSR